MLPKLSFCISIFSNPGGPAGDPEDDWDGGDQVRRRFHKAGESLGHLHRLAGEPNFFKFFTEQTNLEFKQKTFFLHFEAGKWKKSS